MNHRLLVAAALCASLVFAGCAKSRQTTTDTTTTTAGQSADATTAPADADTTPAVDATAAPNAATATSASEADTSTLAPTPAGVNGAAPGTAMTFIVLPVYPGAAENTDQDVAMSANGTSMTMKIYTTRDDTKRVIDWYKAHLPSSFKNFAMSSGDKTTGTFAAEGGDGDQSIIVGTQDDRTTRIQLTTKHGK